jgi:hypothetical protein
MERSQRVSASLQPYGPRDRGWDILLPKCGTYLVYTYQICIMDRVIGNSWTHICFECLVCSDPRAIRDRLSSGTSINHRPVYSERIPSRVLDVGHGEHGAVFVLRCTS